MIRGTTPTLKLSIESEIDLRRCKQIWVTMRQADKEITKTLTETAVDEMAVEKNCIEINLSQSDTLALDPGVVYVQVRGLTAVVLQDSDHGDVHRRVLRAVLQLRLRGRKVRLREMEKIYSRRSVNKNPGGLNLPGFF